MTNHEVPISKYKTHTHTHTHTRTRARARKEVNLIVRTKCPSVMYSQVLKYELNSIYHLQKLCMLNMFNFYIFNSFFKRGLFLRVFIFIQLSLRNLFKLKMKFFFYAIFYYAEHIYRVKRKLNVKCFLWNTKNAVECKKILFYK